MDLKTIIPIIIAHDEANQLQIMQLMQENEELANRIRRLCIMQHNNNMRLAAFYAPNHRIYRPRRLWALERFGKFWELDVPQSSDQFFENSFRADRKCFNMLVEKLKSLEKQDTVFRRSIPLEKRIAIALYALGSSAEYRTVGRLFGVSKAMVRKILLEFCSEAWRVLAPEYLPQNFLTQEKIEECVHGFEAMGFPQCFGAVDGCHIEVKAPAAEAEDYHNYKGWNSVVLFALVDHGCRFHYINVGAPGRCHDAKIYNQSSLKKILEASPLLRKNARQIGKAMVPVMVLGDSAFPFSELLMKPYPFSATSTVEQKTFNYYLSKNRIKVENAFVQLKARFRRLGKGLDNHISKVNAIIKCCCVLHNFFNVHNSNVSDHWIADCIHSERPQPEHNNFWGDTNASAEEIRHAVSLYLCTAAESNVDMEMEAE